MRYIIVDTLKEGYYYRGRTEDNKAYPIFTATKENALVFDSLQEAETTSSQLNNTMVEEFKK